ncbi:MAG: hypothetical protein D6785_14625, partial [Planctomycetota bacterium]
MKCAAALSQNPHWQKNLEEVLSNVLCDLGEQKPHLGILFATTHFKPYLSEMMEIIQKETKVPHLLGSVWQGVIGVRDEVEQGEALSLWMAYLPDCVVEPFHLEYQPDRKKYLGLPAISSPFENEWLVLMVDPYTFPAESFLKWSNNEFPGLQITGGISSAVHAPYEIALHWNDRIYFRGALGVRLSGNLKITTLVAQACRPIGNYLVVTAARDNMIYQLGGKPPLEKFQDLLFEISGKDQGLLNLGIHLGLAVNAAQSHFHMGDFLVRSVVGITQPQGALVINDFVRPGQTVQFHVRDSQAAIKDFESLLKKVRKREFKGGLLFDCNG